MIGRIKKWFWHNQVFHSRGQQVKFWIRVSAKFTLILNLLFLGTMVFLFVNVFGVPNAIDADHGEDIRSVYIDDSDVDVLREKYDEDLEKGFCVYGSYSRYSVQIEDVVHNSDPMIQDEGSIRFNCIDETVERLPELVNNESYYLIGNIHTHPEYAKLSRPDAFTFGVTNMFQETFGVYNGVELEFFTSRSLSYGLDKYVED